MTVHISPMGSVAFVMSVLVTYFVFKASRQRHLGPPSTGDLVGSIAAGAAVFTVLYMLLGAGGLAAPTGEAGPAEQKPAVSKTTDPAAPGSANPAVVTGGGHE
ncbi:hypothetical protein [Streptomyces sp. H27-S2]|uniref:hypothetical protein n=1 Tax=Streptomyces antarcticus TaxID=2996458 RepID=UPI00226DEBCD|nr:hypothetical protein [Streptomyces sp. H27-S2]MCY0954154.1 hypothetical protein [Streptomyces sp. H27-S2]